MKRIVLKMVLTLGGVLAVCGRAGKEKNEAYSYIANSLSLDCGFHGESGRKDQTEAYAVTQYGNVEVTIYQEESEGYLNAILDVPDNGRTKILSDVLGFDVRRVEMEETAPNHGAGI